MGSVFLVGYLWSILAPRSAGTAIFLVVGISLYAISVPWASRFHRIFALVSLMVFGVVVLSGRFEATEFFEQLPTYFGIVAVLLVLSVAGYPIRAARYEVQIRALMAALGRRGAGIKTTAGVLGHVLGAVLDVGNLVLINVIFGRAAPGERVEALKWAGRAFSFVPLWTNLNLLTATTITLTGVSYPSLLKVSLPFVLLCLTITLLAAQRERSELEEVPDAPLDRGAGAVILYPVLLISAVALVNQFFPALSLIAAIAVTVAAIVVLIAGLAVLLLRRTSPVLRLSRETQNSLSTSHNEFALFGSTGVLVLSLQALGVLAPLGGLLSTLPALFVAPVLMLMMAVGFVVGIHVIPLVLLIDAAFPLSSGPAPALWAVAILLGSQAMILLTPFSTSVTMLSRLSGLHPLEIGFKRNWQFAALASLAATLYLGLLSALLL